MLSAGSPDPLARDAVVVHSKGFERWIGMQIAQRTGICANVEFLFPNDLVAAALSAVLGPDGAVAWTADRIAWAVLASLPHLDACPELQPVRDFIAAGDGIDEGRRRIEIAQQIAQLFERYASYRPELAARWSSGEGTGWEPPLWRAVAERLDGQDLGSLVDAFERGIHAADLSSLPARIAVFSVATLPPLFLRVLEALGRRHEVHLFVLGPTPGRWSDDEPTDTHPLLESMGGLPRDFQASIRALDHDLRPADSGAPPPSASLLSRLQADVRDGRVGPRPHPLAARDRSVQVHACHGPMRQVQVLRDALLDLFESLPDLEPRDVVVMTPDIDAFSPLVRAVFDDGLPWAKRDAHPGGLPRLAFRIADEGVRSANPAADVLLALLELCGGRLKATDVVDLLTRERVRTRFGIATEDLPTIREWIDGSGIRWGADADHRAAVGQPRTDLYTWRLGLDRLLLGQAVAAQDTLLLDALPDGDVEGRDGRALLGGFVDFAERVLETTAALEAPRPLEAWRSALLEALDAFVSTEGGAWQLEQVRQGLEDLVEASRDGGFDDVLDGGAIDALLRGRFSVSEPGQGFLTGGITFCRLVPMRSIPFRVVCMLGMDDGAFPRTQGGLSFDRIEQAPRLGDRSPAADDRALFLESVLSARDSLVVTYSGRSPRSNVRQAPSVPVAELLDLVDLTAEAPDGAPASEAITTHHPLQPFSPRAFSTDRRAGAPAFDRRHAEAARAWVDSQGAPRTERPFVETRASTALAPDATVNIDELARFFRDPLAWYVRNHLGLWTSDDEGTVEDREPVSKPDPLTRWKLRDELLREGLAGRSTDRPSAVWERIRRRAGLPLGMPGEVLYDELAGEAALITARALERRGGERREPLELDLPLGDRRLVGRIDDLFPGGRVVARAGSAGPKYLIGLWIRHVAACATGWSGRSVLVGRGDESGFAPLPPDDAHREVSAMVRLYAEGSRAPLLFFPQRGLQLAVALADDEYIAAAELWPPSEFDCPERVRVLGERNPFRLDFSDPVLAPVPELSAAELALRIWNPALRHALETNP